ncbi:hypothetical protein [Maridesulfovibrio bastinii]|uniref:hypothetical protein n=1 Tax=Maridesulfovibrio bastinii TaxID=47157 RepID=UPI0004209FC6|nr:hypothetical protein [Maridesulfovibrio bastinii]
MFDSYLLALAYGSPDHVLESHFYEGLQSMYSEMSLFNCPDILPGKISETDWYKSGGWEECRKAIYPDPTMYLDGVAKGDEEQIQNYKNKCMAVKTQFPKIV